MAASLSIAPSCDAEPSAAPEIEEAAASPSADVVSQAVEASDLEDDLLVAVPPEWNYLGKFEVGEPATSFESEFSEGESGSVDFEESPSENSIVWFQVASGDAWELEYTPEQLLEIAALAEARGLLDPNPGPDGEPSEGRPAALEIGSESPQASHGLGDFEAEPEVQGTISNNVDTRTLRTVAEGWPLTEWPYRAIGKMGGDDAGCTGQLIGRRTVITAAHCVWDRSKNALRPPSDFRARSDPSSDAPYGDAQITDYGIPAGYTNPSATGDVSFVSVWAAPCGATRPSVGLRTFTRPTAPVGTASSTSTATAHPECRARRSTAPTRRSGWR